MIILFLFNLVRPLLMPITSSDLIMVESLAVEYQIIKDRPYHPFVARKNHQLDRTALANDGKFLVFGYQTNQLAKTEAFVQANSGKVIKVSQTGGDYLLAYFPNFDIEDNPAILTQAEKLDFIRYAEPALKMVRCYLPNDSFFLTYQWDKWVMYADLIWEVTLGSPQVIVAICDEGVDYLHPDLSGNFSASLFGYDLVDSDPDPYPDSRDESHGTHIAGIIGAIINNAIGIAGWAQIRFLSVRVLDESGSGSDYDVAEGIRWATNNGAKIINLSLGSYEFSSVLSEAVQYAWQNNVLLFGAVGNDGFSDIYYPAKFDECIAVGALDQNNTLANFSNYGSKQELVCPGVSILSTINDNRYGIYYGTSMACPQASGVAALILSLFPNLSNHYLRAILAVSAIDLGTRGKDYIYGYGLLNAFRAYLLANELITKDKMVKNQDWRKILEKPLKLILYDALGRKLNKTDSPGIYFLKDGYSNKQIKKVVIR